MSGDQHAGHGLDESSQACTACEAVHGVIRYRNLVPLCQRCLAVKGVLVTNLSEATAESARILRGERIESRSVDRRATAQREQAAKARLAAPLPPPKRVVDGRLLRRSDGVKHGG